MSRMHDFGLKCLPSDRGRQDLAVASRVVQPRSTGLRCPEREKSGCVSSLDYAGTDPQARIMIRLALCGLAVVGMMALAAG